MLKHSNLVMRLCSQLSWELTEDMDDVLAFSESSLKNLARESNAYFQMNEQRKEEKEREMYILFSSLFSLLPFVSYSVGKLSMKREQARSLGIYRTPDLKGSSTNPLILQLKRNHKMGKCKQDFS